MVDAELRFLQDLAVVTGVAALTSILFQRMRLPLVFGLLAAGVIIGPNTPPFSLVQDLHTLEVLANLGVTLLLFGLGLEFELRGLKRFGLGAIVVTAAEVLLMFGVGFQTARFLGWDAVDAAYLGAMLSISSTAIIVAVLRELGRMGEDSSRLVFAVLVLEDIAAILILVLLGGYSATGDLPLSDALLVLARMALFLFAFLLLGLLVVPRFVDWVAGRFRPEVVVLAVVALALGGGVLSAVAGFHVGLGAFLVGALCSEAKRRGVVEERFRPIHDLFAAIFFVAIGTLVDFRILADYWPTVLIVTLAIIVGKALSGGLSAFLAGYTPRTSFAVGVALSQIGEFSFVIAALGLSTGTMSPALFPVIVGAAAVTSFTSPLLIRSSDRIARSMERLVPLPVRTFAAIYGGFLSNWKSQRRDHPAAIRRARRNAAVSATLLLLAAGGALVLENLGIAFLARRAMPAPAIVFWAVALAVIIASFLEFDRHLRRFVDLLHQTDAKAAEGLGVRGVVRAAVYLGMMLSVGVPVLLAAGRSVRGPASVIVWLVLVLVATILLWRGIRRLHHRVSENLGRILEDERAPVPVPEVLETLLSRNFPMQFQVETLVLPTGSIWAERRVAETKLRATTGASIVLLERADGRQLAPGPETLLLPGDRITILGSAEQDATAREVLLGRRPNESAKLPLQPGRLVVEAGGPLDGRLLVESGLRTRHGLHVVAIQRQDQAIANPLPSERIQQGDVLIVLGTQEQIFAAIEESRTPTQPTEP